MSKMKWDRVKRESQNTKNDKRSDPFKGKMYTTRFDSAVRTIKKKHPDWSYDQVIKAAQDWLIKITEKEKEH